MFQLGKEKHRLILEDSNIQGDKGRCLQSQEDNRIQLDIDHNHLLELLLLCFYKIQRDISLHKDLCFQQGNSIL